MPRSSTGLLPHRRQRIGLKARDGVTGGGWTRSQCDMRLAFLLPTAALAAFSGAQTNLGLNLLPGAASTTTVGAGSTYNGWTNTGNASIEFVDNTIWQVFEGNGAVDLNGTTGPGAISQTFATTPGQSYLVEFRYSGNPGQFGNRPGAKSFDVAWNGGTAGSFVFTHQTGDAWASMRWLQGSVLVTAVGSSSTLTFQGTSTNYGDAGAAVDAVSITQVVPEPATMAALGLGALALVRRRRKQA